MKIAILLGAGSSLAAGFPSTQCLTQRVLSGVGVSRHSNETYYYNDHTDLPKEIMRLANSMVRRLCAEVERYYLTRLNRQPNYEDLYYLARQLRDEMVGEMDNPALLPFADKLTADASRLISETNMSWCETLTEMCNYIADIVWRNLCHKPDKTCLSQLNNIVYACKSVNVTSISTLCHDVHVETYLREKGIALDDGFSEPEADVRYWNGDFSSAKIPLLKLHGSVDWFHLRPEDSEPWYDDRIGIPLNGDPANTETEDGTDQFALGDRPVLLIGTFNKISEYSRGMFLDLHHHFRSTLREASKLVICGYSFGDKRINGEIIEWYYAEEGRRLVVIDPNPTELVANARRAIANKWCEWKEKGSIELIAKPFEEVGICEFADTIVG